MTRDSKIRVGVVGLGKMGIMHACLLNVLPNVEVAALCDKSRLMRTLANHAFEGALVTDSIEKFSPQNLDAIFVLTPIPSHYYIIKDIYQQNLAKHIFVEKTLTAKYSHSEELANLAEDGGGVNMVGYMKRFGVTFNKIKALLDQKVLGEIASFDAYAFSSDFADVAEGSTLSTARGGVIEDLGSHVVDLAVWLFGDLKVTYAKINSSIAAGSLDDVTFGVLGADGLQGKFDVSWRKSGYRMPEFGLVIHGEKGSLKANDDEVRLELNGNPPTRWYRHDMNDNVGYFLGGSEYWREDKHFVDSILTGQTAKSDFKSTLSVDLLLEQVREQCK
jgi:predicted dehydrogenase